MMIFRSILTILVTLMFSVTGQAVDSLSYSGRLVNANGSPVTGPVNLQFKLSYTNAPTVAICTKTINNVALANGVFHTKLDYSVAECGGTLSLQQVLIATPLNESVAIQVTDLSHSKAYSYQAVHSVPTSLVAVTAKTLDQNGAATGEYLKWNGTKWIPAAAGTGSGSVTQIDTGTGLSGGPITTTGTISIANGGVDTAQLANSAVTDVKVAAGAAIARSKLATGTANYVLVNDGAGVMSGVATIGLGQGGTGATTVPGIWTVLGLGTAAGKDVGNNIGNVMAADVVPSCFAHEKLQMSLAPFFWTCVTDANTDTTKLPLAGGTMTGDIDMDGNQILNLSSPIVGSDAANKTYVDAAVAGSSVWAVATGNAYRLTGNVGVGTSSPDRNVEVVNSDADEAIRITRAANNSDEATVGFVPNGAASSTNQIWKMGLPVNSNNFSLSAFDGSSTTSVLLLSPVGMVIPRLTTTERDAVVSPANGSQIYNTSSNEINYFNGTAWKALGVAGAGVTSLVAGTGLTGGTITSSGTIAVDVGTSAGKILQLNGSSQIPAVDGSLVTNLNPVNLSAAVPITKGGTGLSANGAANTVVGMNNAGTAMEYKAITGTGVTVNHTANTINLTVSGAAPTGTASGDLSGTYPSPSVAALQGTAVSATAPSSGNILLYNGSAYAPTAVSGDATISSTGVVTLATVPVTKGGTGVTSLTGKGIVSVNAAGTGLVSTVCGNMEVLSFNGSGDAGCSPISSLVSTSFIQNGNSFGADAVLGTNDNNSLNFETNATTKMTILPSGEVGIGTASPASKLDVVFADGSLNTDIKTRGVLSEYYGVPFHGGKGGITLVAAGTKAAPAAVPVNAIADVNIPLFFDGTKWRVGSQIQSVVTGVTNNTSVTNDMIFNTGVVTGDAAAGSATGSSEKMRITSAGYVGIGTPSPTAKLTVVGSSLATAAAQTNIAAYTGSGIRLDGSVANTSQDAITYQSGGGGGAAITFRRDGSYGTFLDFYTNNAGTAGAITRAMTINNSGNVGIGTATPSYPLSITSSVVYPAYISSSAGNTRIAIDSTSATPNAGFSMMVNGVAKWSAAAYKTTGTNPSFTFWNDALSAAGLFIYGDTNYVGIGTTTPAQKLQIKGAVAYETDNSTNYVHIRAPNSLAATYGLVLPPALGSAGQVLTTDAAGVLSWSTAATTATNVGGDLSGTIASAEIVAGAVGTTEIANGAVTYSKMTIADGEIPFAKIAPFTTTNVPEGTNWYFTDARVSAALLSSYGVGTAIPLAPTDTLNQALGKLEAQIIANNTANGGMWSKSGTSVYYNSGNVGVGTSSPTAKLHVIGDQVLNSGSGNLGLVPDYSGGAFIQSFQSAGVYRPMSVEGSTVTLTAKNADINLLPTGNVNLGQDANGTMGAYGTVLNFMGLVVNSDPLWMARYNVAGNVSELRMNIGDDPGAAQDSFVIGVTDSSWHPKMTVLSDGKVGIGTSTPKSNLHVAGTTNDYDSRSAIIVDSSNGTSSVIDFAQNGSRKWMIGSDYSSAGGQNFFINDDTTNKFFIDGASGNVGIGSTAPGAKLHVHNSTGTPGDFNAYAGSTVGDIWPKGSVPEAIFHRTGGAPVVNQLTYRGGIGLGEGVGIYSLNHNTAGSSYYGDIRFHTTVWNGVGYTNMDRMVIDVGGNIGIGTTTPSEKLEVNGNAKATAFLYSSDKRLKKNIAPIKKPLEKVLALNGVEFIWRKTGEAETGLIAQDVEKVVPNLVETSAADGMKSVKYGNIVALLIESTKEQQTQALKAQREIASLKEENKKLKADIELIKKHLKIK